MNIKTAIFYKMPKGHAEAFVAISKVYLDTEDEFIKTQARLLMHKISDPVAIFPQKESLTFGVALFGSGLIILAIIGAIHLVAIGWHL
jgi:hypothetical protein